MYSVDCVWLPCILLGYEVGCVSQHRYEKLLTTENRLKQGLDLLK